MATNAEKELIGGWAYQTRLAASWLSGMHAKKLNAMADEMDEVTGYESGTVESPEQRSQGKAADARRASKEAELEE